MRYKNVYFLGIGGIGMSALARYFKAKGFEVAGYDRTRSMLCEELEAENILIHYDDSVELIPTIFLQRDATLIVYTPAIPENHSEFQYFKQQGFTIQ